MCAEAEQRHAEEVEPKKYVSAAEERVIVRAARLRLSTDSKMGVESPEWVRTIAQRPI